MLHYFRKANEFTIQQKTNIFYNQINKNLENLKKLNIPYIQFHIQQIILIPNNNNLPICPYCQETYIFPGKQVANNIQSKHNIIIEQPITLFSSRYIRPAECDHIIPHLNGGTNDIDNGIFVCSRCNKLKSALNTAEFFKEVLLFDYYRNKYILHPKITFNTLELMDADNFNNRCLCCDKPSEYQICWNCAGKKNTLIYIATYNDINNIIWIKHNYF